MEELSEWFLEEFGHLGFDLTPMMYNPDTFQPLKAVLWKSISGDVIKTNLRIAPIFEDIIGEDMEAEYKNIVTQEIYRFLEEHDIKDFKPTQKLNRFKL